MASNVTKSANFDRNLNYKQMKPQINRNLFVLVKEVEARSKKYVPVSPRAGGGNTLGSVRTKKIEEEQYELSSINYERRGGKTRYELENSSVIGPDGTPNRPKHHWFDKGFEDLPSSEKSNIMTNKVVVK